MFSIGSKFSKLEIDQANLIADFISKKPTYQKLSSAKVSSAKRVQQYRERQKQKKLNSSAINLTIENNEQHLSITTPEKSSSTEVIPTPNFLLSSNLLSPSSNISNFSLLYLTNSGHNNHILQPNSSSMEVSEIISSADIDHDNFIVDHSSNVISGNF